MTRALQPSIRQLTLLAAAGGVIHIILDNAGVELFADLCLADVLLSSNLADSVVLHGKAIPWYVSDTMKHDLDHLIDFATNKQPPAEHSGGSSTAGGVPAESWSAVVELGTRWQQYMSTGKFQYQDHMFWTTPFAHWWMDQVRFLH